MDLDATVGVGFVVVVGSMDEDVTTASVILVVVVMVVATGCLSESVSSETFCSNILEIDGGDKVFVLSLEEDVVTELVEAVDLAVLIDLSSFSVFDD